MRDSTGSAIVILPPTIHDGTSAPQPERRVRRPKRKFSPFLYWLGIAALLLVIFFYSSELVRPAVANYSSSDTYSHIANIHDHLEYEGWLTDYSGLSDPISTYLDNVAGISIAYLLLTDLLGFADVITTSLLVNCIALVIAAAIHLKICNTYALRGSAYTFFLNLPLIYFCQLVGKDMLYVTVLYAMLLLVLKERWLALALLAVAAAAVRTQSVIVFFFLLILSFKRLQLKHRVLLLYVLSALAGTQAFIGNKVIGLDADLGGGLSSIVFELNSATRLGNLLLNPVRVLQYVVEFVTAPFWLTTLQIHFFNLFLVPYLLYFAAHLGKLRNALMAIQSRVTQFVFVVVLVMLILPIINLRYFVALLPFIVIAMLVAPQNRRRRPSQHDRTIPPGLTAPRPSIPQEAA